MCSLCISVTCCLIVFFSVYLVFFITWVLGLLTHCFFTSWYRCTICMGASLIFLCISFFFSFDFYFRKVCVFVCLCVYLGVFNIHLEFDRMKSIQLETKKIHAYWKVNNDVSFEQMTIYLSGLRPLFLFLFSCHRICQFFMYYIYIYISLGLFFLKIIHYDYYLASTVIF